MIHILAASKTHLNIEYRYKNKYLPITSIHSVIIHLLKDHPYSEISASFLPSQLNTDIHRDQATIIWTFYLSAKQRNHQW